MSGARKKIGVAVALVLVLSSFGYLVYGGIGENIVYFVTPGELLAKGPDAYEKQIRLGGQVMPGTVQWNADALDLRFMLQDEDGQVTVHSTKAPPAMFREGQGVIVEGRLNREGIFESSTVMVKHSNEYRPPEDGSHPTSADMYKSLIKDQ
jgi:cytochrome c-type biogenesis protein CcmE